MIDRFLRFDRDWKVVGIERVRKEKVEKGKRESERDRKKNHLPWGRGVSALGKLAAPGEGVHIHCMGVEHHRRYPSTDHQDQFLRYCRLQQKRNRHGFDQSCVIRLLLVGHPRSK